MKSVDAKYDIIIYLIEVGLFWKGQPLTVKLNSYLNTKRFLNASDKAAAFSIHSAIKCSCRALSVDQMNPVSWAWNAQFNFFQLIEWHYSWDVLISIYQIDAHDLKNRNAHAIKLLKKASCLSMHSALVTNKMWCNQAKWIYICPQYTFTFLSSCTWHIWSYILQESGNQNTPLIPGIHAVEDFAKRCKTKSRFPLSIFQT